MLNQQIISSQVQPLNYLQTATEALALMGELKYAQMPVVKDGIYEGMLLEEDLLDAEGPETLDNFQFDLQPFSVNGADHFLTAARLSMEQRLKLVPVVNAEREYLGAIAEEDLIRQFSKLNGVSELGALIVLSMQRSQFSTGQLSKLVETNDAVITQLNTFLDEVADQIVVTIRINKEEVSDVIATFQRYDYQVVFFSGQEHYENELKHNYLHLMNFLQI